MAWSTRELAELAGTTVNTIRHYHRLGLLPEPERKLNGYKQYPVAALVRLLRIRRLVDLGVPLARITETGVDGDDPATVLGELDAELAAQQARIQRARDDIAAILRDRAPVDVPQGFEAIGARLSEADQSLIHIYSKLYDPQVMRDVAEMVAAEPVDATRAYDALAPDAPEEVRQSLAQQFATGIIDNADRYPWLADPTQFSADVELTRRTFLAAVQDLYNPAQLDVLARIGQLVAAHREGAAERA